MKEQNAYILGTDQTELFRLGIQHQAWAEEAQRGWRLAGFKRGQTILDLGCGPGFCTKELAFIVGEHGKVIAVDKSEHFIEHLQKVVTLQGLRVEAIHADFDDIHLESDSLDGMYCRWALAWLPEPEKILEKVYKALKPGGVVVLQEYYDWSTHQIRPHQVALQKAIDAALQSFKDSPWEIDIGRKLPHMLANMGMTVTHTRPMIKLLRPSDADWIWPRSFYHSYFPRVKDMGYLSEAEVSAALKDLYEMEHDENATICCPLMIEVIAKKV
ncbi:methyltransferase domain-containing protein [Sungkyunkwania multivorans]|uniref:Methyltransferase domain-containing protein n=1 Tax=Sungkyunkwania multivorans TaxID=1173618 RepID=A0ABW3CSD5_9FLAO